jgi:hypothetical protein
MDSKLIELLSEEIRETKRLILEVREDRKRLEDLVVAAQATAKEAAITAKEAALIAKEAGRKADAAWELVVMNREEMKKPFWKKWR